MVDTKCLLAFCLCLGLCAETARGLPAFRVTTFGKLWALSIDGKTVTPGPNADDPNHSDTYELTSLPEVIALKIKNVNFHSAFVLADLLDSDGKVVMTSNAASWRCTEEDKKYWYDPGYDNSHWYSPLEWVANDIEGEEEAVPDMSLNAKWISPRMGISNLICRYDKGQVLREPYRIKSPEEAINHMSEKLMESVEDSDNPLKAIFDGLDRKNKLDEAYNVPEFCDLVEVLMAEDKLRHEPRDTDYLELLQELLKDNVLAISFFPPGFFGVLGLDNQLMCLNKVVEAVTNLMRPSFDHVIKPDDPYPSPVLGETACGWPRYDCTDQKDSRYRSQDGSCNNLDNPNWGKANIPFLRYLEPNYGDGESTMRQDAYHRDLPNERTISFTLAQDEDFIHPYNTLASMVWGQFLDHDITRTPLATAGEYGDIEDVSCGADNCQMDHPACLPVSKPHDDPFVSGQPCIGFIRSRPVPSMPCDDDKVREQLNAQTAYIDASHVYGSSREESDKLRVKDESGMLIETDNRFHPDTKPLLMESDTGCEVHNSTHHCFMAGDPRVNEHHALASFHTIFSREHNRIVEHLKKENPHWDGDKLYQEGRKIVGAIMQHITYNEYLPMIVGKNAMAGSGLEPLASGYFTGYDGTVDPSIFNEFAAAAYRFGHSMITQNFKRTDANWSDNSKYHDFLVSEQFFDPSAMYDGLDSFMRGIVYQSTQKCDRYYVPQVTNHLFTLNPPHGPGSDLFLLNLRRAREHGISGYNLYREYCGLGRAKNFDDFTEIFDYDGGDTLGIFKSLYDDVDDVDLYPALISERAIDGAIVGPTIACLIMEQFLNLKTGDRFFYENEGPQAFTPDQLDEIRKSATMSSVICRNSDHIDTIQPWALYKPFRQAFPTRDYAAYDVADHGLTESEFNAKWDNNFNARVKCTDLHDFDFSAWTET